MRDWLAIPLSPTSPSASIKNSSDDEYDIVNKSTTEEEEEEGEFTLVSILNAFIDIGKQQLKTRSMSMSSSSSTSSSAAARNYNKRSIQDLEIKKNDKPLANNKIVCNEIDDDIGEITEEEEYSHDEEEEDEEEYTRQQEDDEEEEHYELKRTLSNSSIASSTDTDNSTPASSQIMGPSTSKQLFNMSTINKSLVEICWNHGGKKVQVTGEFDNWSGSVDMIQDTENIQRHVALIPIDASKKDIEYKFIVDGEWKYAIDLPHRTDWRGNVNNVVYKTKSLL